KVPNRFAYSAIPCFKYFSFNLPTPIIFIFIRNPPSHTSYSQSYPHIHNYISYILLRIYFRHKIYCFLICQESITYSQEYLTKLIFITTYKCYYINGYFDYYSSIIKLLTFIPQSVDNFVFVFFLYSVAFYDFSTALKLVIQKSIHKIKNTYLSYKICAKISN